MTGTVNTITIPLNRLVPGTDNVRRTGRTASIGELTASILAHGLRQNLNVRAADSGRFAVVAGGRRLRALKQLAKEKHLPKDYPVPCRVLADNEHAGEISLAENVCRVCLLMFPASSRNQRCADLYIAQEFMKPHNEKTVQAVGLLTASYVLPNVKDAIKIVAAFKGACQRGIYDNMKTAMETIFVGRERAYNRRFLQMCSHHLVDPVACTPASGWEKGQVENQVGLVRERFFTPRLRVRSFEELNAILLDQCIAYAKVHPHPEFRDRTVWQAFEAERPSLVPYAGRFDGFHAVPASVSKTCLVRFDNNRYSVAASAIGRPVEVRAYADRIEVRQDGRLVGNHPRAFGRDQTVFDPWHYVPVLARKPGALRNGAPFKNWVLPAGLDRVRRKLAGADDGNRQMVAILTAVLSDGLPAVEAACQEALREGVHSADVVLNILARQREPQATAITVITPDALRLRHEPSADCARYDSLRRAG